MIRSMTGFGEAERDTAAGRLRVEIRTVNHRFFNPAIRLPASEQRWETEVREWLRAHFSRGHVSCSVRLVVPEGVAAAAVRLDEPRVRAYLAAYARLRDEFGVPGEPDLALLARHGDILLREGEDEAPRLGEEDLRACVDDAARANLQMRSAEGARLAADMGERLAAIEGALARVGEVAPARLERERERLRAAVGELIQGERRVDEGRLEQEIVLIAERWDVNEELVRFAAHHDAFRGFLAGEAEAVGKRLSFLVQEMHREANTIGSKANDAAIAHQVVAIKDEIERLREQAENVE
jgi:uncharacterized protein (TIGR00255 family)